jgi:thiol-disulfide isomerase/thioredoxin
LARLKQFPVDNFLPGRQMGVKLHRRTLLAGIAGLALAGPSAVHADDLPDSPVAHGVLAKNPLALGFEPLTRITVLPDVTLTGRNDRELEVSDLKGRTLLISLWAEWCPSCLTELSDFARLQQKYGNDRFAIIPILTGTEKRFTTAVLAEFFGYLHAGIFEPLMEKNRRDKLMQTMAQKGRGVEMPCNLLVAPNGTVIGREFGAKHSDDQDAMLASADKTQILRRAEAGQVMSLWGQEEGEQFAAAMANGFLAHG